MLTDITTLHEQLKVKLEAFSKIWPLLVVSGKVWQLPLLAEQKAPDRIEAQMLEGAAAIEAAQHAMA